MFKRHTPVELLLLAAVVALAAGAQPAHAIKVCTYNLTNFPSDYALREASFRLVMDEIDADVIVGQEVESWQATDIFCDYILNYAEPGKYTWMPFINGPDTDNACFFKPDVLDSVDYGYLDTGVRYTTWYKFRPVGYDSPDAEFVIFSTHLKAGTASQDLDDRLDQTTIIRNYMNAYPSGSNFMVAGDFNIQASSEGSYQMLIGYQTDNDGRCKDPINTGGTWHDNYSLRTTHTQSPRIDGGSGTGGGMDDRFDFILVSYALDDGEGLSYVDYSYVPFGNDGLRFNLDINDPPNQIVSAAVADALYTAADHIPVFLELQLPAKLDAVAELAFGGVLIGAAVEETLTVGNAAASPAADLSYSLAAPAGFTAPGGSFVAGAASSNEHAISVDTGSVGVKSGDLTVSSNDLDDPTWLVALSATVLDHASPSFDEFAVDLGDTVDFGSHAVGAFTDETLYIYNEGYNTLQSLLDVYDVEIVGGDGRFSIVGGFGQQMVGGTPGEYAIAFDASGSPDNTLYEAVITFSTRDDPGNPGGVDLADAVIFTSAFVTTGTGIEDEILALALSPGSPNPFTAETSLQFSLPAAEHALIEVYDVSGRLVATLADGTMPAGASRVVWDGRDSTGSPAASGIYFCRAAVGDWREARKVVLLR